MIVFYHKVKIRTSSIYSLLCKLHREKKRTLLKALTLQRMFSLKDMPASMTTLFSAYASITTFLMLIRTLVNELLPSEIRSYLLSLFHYFFTTPSSSNQLTLIIDQESRFTHNQIYEAATVYLRTKTSPSTERLKVSKTTRQKNVTVSIVKGETIIDFFENFELKWKYSSEREHEHEPEKTFFELSFDNKFKETVMGSYLPHVLATWVEIKEKEKVVKLYTRNYNGGDDDEYGSRRGWGSINLEHPVTFEKLAMDPELKQGIMDDLDRFVRRKKYYKSVGKAWKRGYLLYGPPGTGKSSLIAAMANYLKFDIYDLELSQVYNDSNLRRILMSTSNRSILAIEDIDCSVVQDRENGSEDHQDSNTNNKVCVLLLFQVLIN